MDKTNNIEQRAIVGMHVRNYTPSTRQATFVAATESGVDTIFGREYLDMQGLDLTRFNSNPVVLNTHNRSDIDAIVGRASVRVSGNELIADITFTDKTESGAKAMALVEGDFLRTLSVGFLPKTASIIQEGETTELGTRTIIGPARIVREWELFEISVVPVPADAEAVKRNLSEETILKLAEVIKAFSNERNVMADEDKSIEEDAIDKDAVDTAADEDTDADVDTAEEDADVTEEDAEVERKAAILEITPVGYEAIAERCIIEGSTVEETRAILLEENAKRIAPVGTVEPVVSVPQKKECTISARDITG